MWTLILTIVIYNPDGKTTAANATSVFGFSSQQSCLQAGRAWAENNSKLLTRAAGTAICVPNGGAEAAPQRPPLSKF